MKSALSFSLMVSIGVGCSNTAESSLGGEAGATTGESGGAGGTNSAGAPVSGGSNGTGGSGFAGGDCNGDPMAGPATADVVIALSGVSVETLAGSEVAGAQDGAGSAAHFNNPTSVMLNANGNIVVSDFDNGRIRSVTAGGMVQTLTQATGFARPFALALGPSAEIYVGTDYDEKGVNAGLAGGVLWRLNGGEEAPTALALKAGRPRGLVAMDGEVLAVTDIEGHDLRSFDIESQTFSDYSGKRGCPGFADGTLEQARFNRPYGLVRLPNGDLIIADQNNHRLRRVSSTGDVTTSTCRKPWRSTPLATSTSPTLGIIAFVGLAPRALLRRWRATGQRASRTATARPPGSRDKKASRSLTESST